MSSAPPARRATVPPTSGQAIQPTAPAGTDRLIGPVLAVAGAIGAVAAFVLAVEKFKLITNPDYVPTCSINPILSCGSVMSTAQAEAFGFPNPLIGVATFPLVILLGVLAWARVALPRWTWLGLQAGATFGIVFVHWLMFQSLYRIGALCPYCMVVWVVMITVFVYVTLHNVRHRHLWLPRSWNSAAQAATGLHSFVVALWILIVVGLIAQAFWSQWMLMLA